MLVTVSFLLLPITANAQDGDQSANSDPAVVSGTVVDDATGDGIESATVALLTADADSTTATGTITASDGTFELQHSTPGEYFVRISFVGFQTKVVTDVTIEEDTDEIELGELTLAEGTTEMEEVQVSAERQYMQVEADRTIYNPGEQPVTTGGSGRNVLEQIPSVDVSMEGDISLRGSQGVTIYLNGSPAPMSGQALTSFLEGLSSDDIEQIEVISNPSVAFEPEGSAGIINIVLAEDAERGWGGSISASASTDEDYNGSGNVNYGSGPWSIYSNYSLRLDEDEDSGSRFRINRMADPLTYLNQQSSEQENDVDHTFNTTAEYRFTEQSVISLRGLVSRRTSESEELLDYARRGPDSTMVDEYDRNALSTGTDLNTDYSLEFERIVEPNENELTAEFEVEQEWEDGGDRYLQYDLFQTGGDEVLEEEQHIDESGLETEGEAEVDYIRTLWENGKLEAGYEADFEIMSSEFYSESLNFETGEFQPDTLLNNQFSYDEQMHSVFGILNQSFGDFSAQIGGRLERAVSTFNQETQGEKFNNEYFSFFPSIHLSYSASQANTFNVSYSKRVRRPSSWQMNPYPDYEDPTFRRIGNPYLTPEYTHSFEAGYSRLGEKYTVSFSPYFRYTVDEISWHEEITDDGISILTFENYSTESSFGLELVGSLTLGEWLKANGSVNAFRRETNATNVQSALSNNALGYHARLRLTATITEGLSFQFSQFYRSGHDIPGGHIGASTRSNMALQQKFLNNRMSLNLRASDLLGETGFHITRNTDQFYQESSSRRDPRRVELNLRYNFNQSGGGDRGGDRDYR